VSADQVLLLVAGLIGIAAVAVTVAWATAYPTRRDDLDPALDPIAEPARAGPRATAGTAGETARPIPAAPRPVTAFISPTSTRQAARAVAFLFLATAALVTALTHAWPEVESAIFTLLALGTLLVVLFMDLVPPATFGRWRRPAEGIGAILFLALLTSLSGGATSPFLVGFFLVVAGTALSTEGRAPLAIALLAAGCAVLVAIVDAVGGALEPEAMAWVGLTAVALILLADIATAAARAQRHARDEALRASRFDALTGLYNRAFFFTTMDQEIRRSDRMGRGFTLLMLDLDDLKPVNDTFGHQWGDRLLKAVADTIRSTVRFTDAAARYGGDEFVVLLPETDAAGGFVVAEKLRRDIAALTLRAAQRNVRSSVSVGLVTYPEDGGTLEQLIAAADVAMYESKRTGKNRIVGYQSRNDRAPTIIGIETPGPVTAEAGSDARTGGDPVPWGSPEAAAAPLRPGGPSSPARPASAPRVARVPSILDAIAPPPSPEGGADAPWLTRTVDTPGLPDPTPGSPPGPSTPGTSGTDSRPPRPTSPPPGDPPSQRPAAGPSIPGTSGDIASADQGDAPGGRPERPWVALPIEPWDSPDRPRS
jgi:diguanylate cyclase (GGDEF)-like protein